MRIVADLFFALGLIVCLAAAFLVATSDGRGGFIKLFGVVQSGSMEKSGLHKGDVVFVSRGENYSLGDTIVFYRAPTAYDERASRTNTKDCSVWIHEIIDIRTDELGRECYLTKGTSNPSDDFFYVPEDFVLGKGKPLPALINLLFRFIVTPAGIITFVVVPSAILFVLLTLDLIFLLLEDEEEDGEETLSIREECAAPAAVGCAPIQATVWAGPKGYFIYPESSMPPTEIVVGELIWTKDGLALKING